MAGAHSGDEYDFTVPAGATATRADDVLQGRGAAASRYKITIINCHPGDPTTAANGRLAVGITQAGAQSATPRVIEADYDERELFMDASMTLWVRPLGADAIPVHMVVWNLA